uniref:Neur_chan_LBD domain-containing protein n=1 Tax=Heterorhabditis bacteriophora TaxID=37862 RepID=A0A1I7WZ59_HETBA
MLVCILPLVHLLYSILLIAEDANSTAFNNTFLAQLFEERKKFFEKLDAGAFINEPRKLVEDLLDPAFYEKHVHPKINYLKPTRINVSMSLYQILDVDEHSQSIVANVWMVQNWFDEFLDWDPRRYGMINKTIVPYNQIWVPDTYLYNSETLEQKKTESLMNAIVETGYWANDSHGARVQLMFPAIYKLSCAMNLLASNLNENTSYIGNINSLTTEPSDFDSMIKKLIIVYIVGNPSKIIYTSRTRKNIETIYTFSFYLVEKMTEQLSNLKQFKIIRFIKYLGINTLLTMSIMMLMVCNQMPSTSTYVPLMSQMPPRPRAFFGSISSEISDTSSYSYTARLATLTRQYTAQVRSKERERRPLLIRQSSQARNVKRHKMSRRSVYRL